MQNNVIIAETKSQTPPGAAIEQANRCNLRRHSGLLSSFQNEDAIMIDFETAEICTLPTTEPQELKASGFRQIPAKFMGSEPFICINIGWKDYYFKFDMDYQGTFIMRRNKKLKFQYLPHEKYEVLNIKDFRTMHTAYYRHRSVRFNHINYNTSIWLTDSQVQSVGVGFIKGFNWIIDFQNKRMYAKKNSVSIDIEDILAKVYTAQAVDNSLSVTHRNLRGNKFKAGDRISAIEGIRLNPDNICDFEILLQQTEHWDKFRIEIDNR